MKKAQLVYNNLITIRERSGVAHDLVRLALENSSLPAQAGSDMYFCLERISNAVLDCSGTNAGIVRANIVKSLYEIQSKALSVQQLVLKQAKENTDGIPKLIVDWKESVRATTTENIALSGQQTIDTVSLLIGDRVLVKDQTDASENGIYIVASGTWSRSTDADIDSEVTTGLTVFVDEGLYYKNDVCVLITPNPIDVSTTELQFTQNSLLIQKYNIESAGSKASLGDYTLDILNEIHKIQDRHFYISTLITEEKLLDFC